MTNKTILSKNAYTLLRAVGMGEGEDDKETFTKDDVSKAVTDAIEKANEVSKKKFETEMTGLKNKNKEILGTLQETTEKLKKVEGVDIEGLTNLQERINNDEILKLASEGKHEEAISKATEKSRATFEAKESEYKKVIDSLSESSTKDKELIVKLMVEDGSKTAFTAAKGRQTALDDIALKARQVWRIEEGQMVARDSNDELIKGEKGPITMVEWVEGLKETFPHFFPDSESAGIKGGKGSDIDLSTIDGKIVKAATEGDVNEVRRLEKLKKEQSGKR